MVVLKKTKSDWRLFWVVELVGFSFVMALAGIKWAGDPEKTMDYTSESNEEDLKFRAVFGWRFLLFHSPVAVTSLSLAVSAIANHLVTLFENGSNRSCLKTLFRVMKPHITAYRVLIAALALLEIAPFMVLIFRPDNPGVAVNDRIDCLLNVVKGAKAVGAVIIGCVCTFCGSIPTASSVMSAGRYSRALYTGAFLGLLFSHPVMYLDSVWGESWNTFNMKIMVRCLSLVVYGFWCHRYWNDLPESSRAVPEQRPRWQTVFVLLWLLSQVFFWSKQNILGYMVEEWTLRLLSAVLYLAVGISVAIEWVGHPCCVESSGFSLRICSLLLAWSLYRLTSWDVLLLPNAIYFGESSGLDVDVEFQMRGVTVQVLLLCLSINAEARSFRKESLQFCLMTIFILHVVVVWCYTVLSDYRLGTFQ